MVNFYQAGKNILIKFWNTLVHIISILVISYGLLYMLFGGWIGLYSGFYSDTAWCIFGGILFNATAYHLFKFLTIKINAETPNSVENASS